MPVSAISTTASPTGRLAFVDTARGLCIILVVMMHSALGVGLAMKGTGFIHDIVAFAKPFRMPDFFLIAGLFLGRSIHLPLRQFVDRKIIHYAYFYVLWLFLILVVKAAELKLLSPAHFLDAYARGLVEPFSTLWFIHLLPFFFIFARMTRALPAGVVVFLATCLHLLAASTLSGNAYALESKMTDSTLVNSFCLYLIYFLIGHYSRSLIFKFAAGVATHPWIALTGLCLWILAEAGGISTGLAELPGPSLVFALCGALALIAVACLLQRSRWFAWLAICGRHSLRIYLAFVIPMALTRVILLKYNVTMSIGLMSALVTVGAIIGALALAKLVKGTRLAFLFKRPAWAHLKDRQSRALPAL